VILVSFTILEVRAIRISDENNEAARRTINTQFQTIATQMSLDFDATMLGVTQVFGKTKEAADISAATERQIQLNRIRQDRELCRDTNLLVANKEVLGAFGLERQLFKSEKSNDASWRKSTQDDANRYFAQTLQPQMKALNERLRVRVPNSEAENDHVLKTVLNEPLYYREFVPVAIYELWEMSQQFCPASKPPFLTDHEKEILQASANAPSRSGRP
jgi:hypothetical protein